MTNETMDIADKDLEATVDWDLCIGSGLCVAAAEDAFELIETDGPVRAAVTDGSADPEALMAAARGCPTLAIRLRAGDRQVFPPT